MALEFRENVRLARQLAARLPCVPALCEVRERLPDQEPHLSTALWNDQKYRYIFFFDTEELDLTWWELREQLDFSPNYNPSGQFMPVKPERLESLGGAEHYVETLRYRYGISHSPLDKSPDTTITQTIGARSTAHVEQTKQQLDRLRKISSRGEPVLTEGRPKVEYRRSATPRDDAFRRGITELYGFKCAICGLGLRAPGGNIEVQSAHIYPKALDGKDDLRNGICLCRMHHWAFDAGWFWLTDDCTIRVRDDVPRTDDYFFISEFHDARIALPAEPDLKPHPRYLRARRELYNVE